MCGVRRYIHLKILEILRVHISTPRLVYGTVAPLGHVQPFFSGWFTKVARSFRQSPPGLEDGAGRGWEQHLHLGHPRSLHLKPTPGDGVFGLKKKWLDSPIRSFFFARQLGRIPASLQEIGFLFRRRCWQACLCSWCFQPCLKHSC